MGPVIGEQAEAHAKIVIDAHTRIANRAVTADDVVPDVDRRRRALVELFRSDLGLPIDPSR